MKKALPWIVMVVVGYVLLIVGVLYLVPGPWNWVISAVVLLMAARFLFTVRKAAELGRRTTRT
jgi:glucose dehydrogenase